MTLLLFSGKHHVINTVMTTRYITLLAGTSNAMTMFVSRMQIFIKIKNFEGHKIPFKDLYLVFANLYFKMNLGSGMCNV